MKPGSHKRHLSICRYVPGTHSYLVFAVSDSLEEPSLHMLSGLQSRGSDVSIGQYYPSGQGFISISPVSSFLTQ